MKFIFRNNDSPEKQFPIKKMHRFKKCIQMHFFNGQNHQKWSKNQISSRICDENFQFLQFYGDFQDILDVAKPPKMALKTHKFWTKA